MSDLYLVRVIEAAEEGKALPALRVVAGNTLFVGQPGPSSAFAEKTIRGMAEARYNAERPTKKNAERVFHESMQRGEEDARPITSATLGAPTGETLTLLDCQVWPASGGDGVQVPVVRIPLAAVDGWWPGAGQRLKADSGGGWLLGFGVVLPVDVEG